MKILNFNDHFQWDKKVFKIEGRKIVFLTSEEDFAEEVFGLIADYSSNFRAGALTFKESQEVCLFLERATEFFYRISLQRK